MNMSASEWLIVAPVATVVIMAVAFVMTLVTSLINRAVISHFVGLDSYRAMQKEMAEFRKESMDAARSNDKKQLEKIKKKQVQINAMQAKTFKIMPIQMVVGFAFLPIFMLVLRPLFWDATVIAIPGISMPITIFGFSTPSFMIWYLIVGIFFSTIMTRVLGTMPIE